MHLFRTVFILLIYTLHLSADPEKNVFILHSYAQEYPWTRLQHQGFISSLDHQAGYGIVVSTENLDTKRVRFTSDYESFFLDYLRQKYANYRPDLIYATDDNSVMFMVRHRDTLFPGVPVFFSGVNDTALAPLLMKKKFTGVFETKEITPNIELIRQYSPQTRDIWIIGDESSTYASIEREIKSHVGRFPNMHFHFISSTLFQDVMTKLPARDRAFVVLTTIGEWRDAYGKLMGVRESIEQLRQRSNLVLCSMEDAYMLGGVIGGYVTSGTEQGKTASRMAKAYLDGKDFTTIPMVTKSPNVYMFDHHALTRSRIILSEYTARNAIVLHEEENFINRNKEIVLNVLFVIAVIFMAYLVLSFFLFLEKRSRIRQLEKEIDLLSYDKEKEDDILLTLQEGFRIGWWEYDVQSGAVYCSDPMCDILQIDRDEIDGIESLMLMIHPGDQTRIESIVRDAAKQHLAQKSRHKIIAQSGTVYTVDHYFRSYQSKSDGGMVVMGIMQVQNA